jgi:hypothetical protein
VLASSWRHVEDQRPVIGDRRHRGADLLDDEIGMVGENVVELAVRAVREQVDWAAVRADTAHNDFAAAFLVLTDRLEITAQVRSAW